MATLDIEKARVETPKATTLDVEALKRRITAIKAAPSGINRLLQPHRASGPTDEARKLLTPALARAGIDASKLDAMLKGTPQFDQPSAPAPALKDLDQARKDLIAAIENQGTALQKLRPPYSTPSTSEWVQPFWIVPVPVGMVTNISPLAGYNLVQLKIDARTDGQYEVRFYFVWANPSQYETVIDIRTSGLLSGRHSAWSAGGFWWGDRYCEMRSYLFMNIFTSWQNSVINAADVLVSQIECDSGGLFASAASNTLDYVQSKFLNDLQFPVQGHGSVVVEVIAVLACNVADGEAVFDYSNPGQGIISPGVLITNYGPPA